MRKVLRACIGLFFGVLMTSAAASASSYKLVPTAPSSTVEYSSLKDYSASGILASTVTPIYSFASFVNALSATTGVLSSTDYEAIFPESLGVTASIVPQSPYSSSSSSPADTYTTTQAPSSGGIGFNTNTGVITINTTNAGAYTITTAQSGATPYRILVQELVIVASSTITKTCSEAGSISATVSFFGPSSNLLATLTGSGITGSRTSTVSDAGLINFADLPAGTYTLVVEHVGLAGSSVTTSITVGDIPSALTLTATPSAVACFGQNTGSFNATWGGGYSGTTYSLEVQGPTPVSTLTTTFTGLTALARSAGTYTMTVIDVVGGCSATTSFSIAEGPALTLTATSVSVTCSGSSDGVIVAQFAGGGITTTGASTYTLTLNEPGVATPTTVTSTAGTYTFTGRSAGTYTLTLEGAGCTTSTTRSITIGSPATLTATVAGKSSSTNGSYNINCNGGTGSISVTASGGTASYTYIIDAGTYSYTVSGETSVLFTGVRQGTYTLTVLDANSCSTTISSITMLEPPALTLTGTISSNYSGFSVSCNGARDGAINVTASGGVSSTYTFELTSSSVSNQNIVGTGANVTFSGLAAGSYTVSVTDANGCTATQRDRKSVV